MQLCQNQDAYFGNSSETIRRANFIYLQITSRILFYLRRSTVSFTSNYSDFLCCKHLLLHYAPLFSEANRSFQLQRVKVVYICFTIPIAVDASCSYFTDFAKFWINSVCLSVLIIVLHDLCVVCVVP